GGAALAIGIQGSEDSLGYVIDLAEDVDLDKQAARSVDLQQRLGLLGIDLQAYADGFLVVIRSAFDLGAPEQSCHDLVGVGNERDDGLERSLALGEVVI